MDKFQEIELRLESNTDQNLDYYSKLAEFISNDVSQPLQLIKNFAVYTPRQFLTDFLVRYELFKLITNVAGSVLEFGVLNGQGLMSMANFSAILEPTNLSREIFGFDTFTGFPSISIEDGKDPLVKQGGFSVDGSLERLQQAISLYDSNRYLGHIQKINLIKGDVTHTLPAFFKDNPHVIPALVYLDMDLYGPTKYVLETIYDRIPRGAIVAFDELNHRSFPGESIALHEALGLGNISLKRLSFCSRISYFIK